MNFLLLKEDKLEIKYVQDKGKKNGWFFIFVGMCLFIFEVSGQNWKIVC